MDFISNFIKRPLSLVLNEATETTAKVSTTPSSPSSSSPALPSSSLSNSLSLSLSKMKADRVVERAAAACESPPKSLKQSPSPLSEYRTLSNNTTPTATTPVRRSPISSSYHGQISEFLDITNKLINYDDFRQLNPLDMDFDMSRTNNENSSLSPEGEKATVAECKTPPNTSQTIEQLLIEINDNLNQADRVEDVCNLSLSASPHAQV